MISKNAIKKNVLITGVAGFLGRYVAQYFSSQGYTVIGIDSVPPENASISNFATYYRLRLPNAELGHVLHHTMPEVCIHCAGRASIPLSIADPSDDYYTNTVLTFEVLEALRRNAPECKFIFVSSAAVYGNPQSLPVSENESAAPISPYGFHKLQGELQCAEFSKIYDLPTASIRIFSAYGPGLRRQVLWDICRMAVINKSVMLQGTGDESRDFIHALDVARAMHFIATKGSMTGNVYNLASGREVTIKDLATSILEALGINCALQFNGIVPVGTPLNWCADMSKMRSLGFEVSVPFKEGVYTYTKWCRAELMGV